MAPNAEFHLPKFLASYSHDDWGIEQRAERLCRAVIKRFHRDSPTPIPLNVLHPVGTNVAPTVRDVLDFADKTTLYETDDGIDLLVRKLTPTIDTKRLPRHLCDKHITSMYLNRCVLGR